MCVCVCVYLEEAEMVPSRYLEQKSPSVTEGGRARREEKSHKHYVLCVELGSNLSLVSPA